MTMASVIIRDARPEDAPFLAKCVMAGMHYYDFGQLDPGHEQAHFSPTQGTTIKS